MYMYPTDTDDTRSSEIIEELLMHMELKEGWICTHLHINIRYMLNKKKHNEIFYTDPRDIGSFLKSNKKVDEYCVIQDILYMYKAVYFFIPDNRGYPVMHKRLVGIKRILVEPDDSEVLLFAARHEYDKGEIEEQTPVIPMNPKPSHTKKSA